MPMSIDDTRAFVFVCLYDDGCAVGCVVLFR